VVRHPLVQDIIRAYNHTDRKRKNLRRPETFGISPRSPKRPGTIMAILITNRQAIVRLDIPSLRRSIRRILKHLGRGRDEISILLVEDREIRVINKTYLKRDGRPTSWLFHAGRPIPENPSSGSG